MKFERLWHIPYGPLWFCEPILESNIIHMKNFLGIQRRNVLFFSKNGDLVTYMGKKDIQESARFGLQYYQSWKNFLKIKKIMQTTSADLYQNLDRISKINFLKIPLQDFFAEYKNTIRILGKQIAAYQSTQPAFTILLERELIKDRAVNKIVFSPAKIDPLRKSEIEIRRAALQIIDGANLEVKARNYWQNFYFILGGLGKPVPTILDIKKRIKKESKKGKIKLKKEIQEIHEKLLTLRKEVFKAEKNLQAKEKVKARIIRELAYLRFTNRFAWTKASIDIHNIFFKALARRLKIPLPHLLNLKSDELEEPLKRSLIKKIERGSQQFVYGVKNGNQILITDPRLVQKLLAEIKDQEISLQGLGVSEGKAKGRAFIIKFQKGFGKQIELMRKGDILVTGNTTPQMMPAVMKAHGIVTEEGGILSHASIVSRELKIPCLVGVRGILDTVKTGDLIELDAYKEKVRIIKKQ